MTICRSIAMTFVILLVLISWNAPLVLGQSAPQRSSDSAKIDQREAARRTILNSDRWQQTHRAFNQWLSVQRIYSPNEVAALKTELKSRIAKMSAPELEALLEDMEQRLEVLASPEAADAREWVSQFLAVARNSEEQLRQKRPDVMNMSAGQIRDELQKLQRQRDSRRQAQAAFDQQRAFQVQAAQSRQAAVKQGRQQAQEQSSRAATHATHQSQYAPQRDMRPAPFTSPIYTVGPWGAPVRWHPLGGYW